MKKIAWIITTLFALVFLGGLSLPMIASTSLGKKIVVSILSKKMKGKLQVGSWNLTWFGPQVIQSVEFQSKGLDCSFTKFYADLPFWSLFPFSRFEKQIFSDLDGKIELAHADLILYAPNEPPAYFKDLNGSLTGSKGENIDFSLFGNTQVENVSGTLSIDAKIDSVEEMFIKLPHFIKVNLVHFPTMGIDRWAQSLKLKRKNPLFQAIIKEKDLFLKILGERLNFDFTLSSNEDVGNVQARLNATNGEGTLNASVANKYLYLNEPALAKIQFTPFLSKYFIKDVNPLFITGVSGFNPITLEISPQGFILPLDPFSIQNLSIEKATLDMGKIRCENGGTLSLIIGLLKLHSLEKIEEMNVWFTPVNIQIKDGTLVTDRMDALVADTFHICTWGDINLMNKKIDMILGITADALKRSFQIKNLPPEYVMQIPLTGTTKNPDLNAGVLATKIAALIAAQKASEKVFGLSDFFKVLQTQEQTPPPKRPFPWER